MVAKSASAHQTGDAPSTPPNSLPPDGITRWVELKKLIQCSREWVRLREKEGRFPKRLRLTERCVAWPNRELHRYFADPVNYRAEG